MTPLETLRASKSQQSSSPEKKMTPLELYRVEHPVEPSTLGKVAGFLAPTITKTVGKIKKGEDVTARDIGGSALEAASYLIPGGAIAKGVGGVIKAGTMASKLAIPASIGAVSGATFGAGQAVSRGEGLGGVAKEALKGAAIGTAFGGGLGVAGAGLAARKLAQKTPTEYYQEALQRADFGPIPEVGKPTIPGQIAPEAVPPIVAPEVQPVGFRPKTVAEVPEVLPVAPKSPLHQQVAKYKTAEEFVNGRNVEVVLDNNKIIDTTATMSSLPKVPEGYERFYRAESPTVKHGDAWGEKGGMLPTGFQKGDSFHLTPDIKYANYYKETYGKDAKISYFDLPKGLAKASDKFEGEFTVNKSQLTDIWKEAQGKTGAKIPQSPEYVKSVETRAQKMAEKDPEFIPSTDAVKIVKLDELSKTTPKEQMVRWSTGVDRNVPEGIPPTTLRNWVEDDMLSNPSKYTPDEIFRVSTSAVNSEAGAALQGVKVKSGKVADTPMDFIRQEQSKLQEKIKAERLITKSTIKRFLDELPVCTI